MEVDAKTMFPICDAHTPGEPKEILGGVQTEKYLLFSSFWIYCHS